MKDYKDKIIESVEQGYVSVQKHPEIDLWIYNYTPKCVFEKFWNEVTLQCRGLILDRDFNIVARPFPKFFNIEEIQKLPDEPFEVTQKLDGSLGILYTFREKGEIYYGIATRGSFVSEQALVGSSILNEVMNNFWFIPWIVSVDGKQKVTLLFEIIYPENRIVVNYGDRRELVLLAAIDNDTGKDLPLENFSNLGVSIVKRFDGIKDINLLKGMERENEEGFVVRFLNSCTRVKVKFKEYIRLHKILTQTSNKTVWEHLKDGKPFDELLQRVPDEFYDYVRSVKSDLERKYSELEWRARYALKLSEGRTRKEFALAVMGSYPDIAGIVFNMLDGKDYSQQIWRMIKPKYEKPFRKEI
jgi:RNA ligase